MTKKTTSAKPPVTKSGRSPLNLSINQKLAELAKIHFANAPRSRGLSATLERLLRRELQAKGVRVPALTK